MKRTPWTVGWFVFLVAACGPERQPDVEPLEEVAPAPAPGTAAAPDTTPESLWSHMQTTDYRSWPHYPGTGELYAGTEPHGMLLTTYVNRIAQDALAAGTVPLPAGSIIVKENYMPDSTFDASTVMHKVPGYDPQNGDWYWAKYDANGVADAAGRADMCQQCHGAARQRDFILTPPPGR